MNDTTEPSQPLTDAELEVIRSCVKQAKLFNEDDFPLAFGDRERLLAEVDRLRAELALTVRARDYLATRLENQVEAHERTTQRLENAYAERALLFSELKRTVEGQTNE